MAIHKRFIHFKEFKDFNSKKLSANETNTQYTLGVSGEIQEGDPDVLYQSYVWIKDTQQQWTHGQLYNGRHFVVDEILSDDSINPVANKAIKEYVDLHSQYEPVDEINVPVLELPMVKTDDALSATSIYPVQNRVVTHALNSKVDKVLGKQLSTEDFTTILKNKLLGLTNYDDTAINNAVKSLETRLNTLVNGDVTTAIDSYNDIIAFLENISDYETLDGIIAGIERQIAAIQQSIPDTSNLATKAELNSKQNILVSGTNIKTINGENILGSGNVEINTKITVDDYVSDTSTNPIQNKVIKKYIDNKVINIDTTNLATKAELNAKQDKISDLNVIRQGAMLGGTALQSVPDEYITENDLNSKGYITQAQLINKQDTIEDLEAIRRGAFLGATALQEDQFKGTVTSIVMNEEVQPQNDTGIVNLGSILTEHQDVSHLATKEELNTVVTEILNNEEIIAETLTDLNDQIDAVSTNIVNNIATKEELQTSKQLTNNYINDNAEVQAAALNDLKRRIQNTDSHIEAHIATKEELQDLVNSIINTNERINAESISDLNNRIEDLTEYIEAHIATKEDLESSKNAITASNLNSEQIHAAALNDLEERKADKEQINSTLNYVLSEVIKFQNTGVPLITLTDEVVSLKSNVYYQWESPMSSINVSFTDSSDTDRLHNYMFEFTANTAGCILTMPEGIKWANAEIPTFEEHLTYQVSVINNLAVASEFG